jgi:hypothetical protein
LSSIVSSNVGPEIIALVINAKTTPPKTDTEATLIIDAIKFLEQTVALAEATQRIRVLTLMIPAAIALLYDSSAAPCAAVHAYALSSITRTGPLYADEFKRIMAAAPQVWLCPFLCVFF